MSSRNEFGYWLMMTLLTAGALYIVYLITNALIGNGIDVRRSFSGMNAERDIYFFATDPAKFCGVMLLYVFSLGGIIYYVSQRAQERKFQIEMMRLRGDK